MDISSASQAVEALVHEYGKLVFYTIYGLTNDWDESQDLTQDTFHQALKAIDAARAASGTQFHAKAWLLHIALNTVRMQRRRRSLMRFIPFSHMQQGVSETDVDTLTEQAAPVQPRGYGTVLADDPAELVAEREAVRLCLAKLPETLRICLLLSIIAGLSSSEIATMLGIKEAAVRQRLVRARQQFQQIYAYESDEEIMDGTTKGGHTHRVGKDATTLRDGRHRLTLASNPSSAWSSYAQ